MTTTIATMMCESNVVVWPKIVILTVCDHYCRREVSLDLCVAAHRERNNLCSVIVIVHVLARAPYCLFV
jgi:hypothetical protein